MKTSNDLCQKCEHSRSLHDPLSKQGDNSEFNQPEWNDGHCRFLSPHGFHKCGSQCKAFVEPPEQAA